MSITLHHENCLDRLEELSREPVHGIFTDPPFNISQVEVTGGEAEIELAGRANVRRDLGEWDKDFKPVPYSLASILAIKSGGWHIIMTSDRLFGGFQDILRTAFNYKFSGAWHVTNPMVSVRQATLVSSIIFFMGGVKSGPTDKIVPPLAWNWLGQENMHNFMEGPNCGSPERLYWHLVDGEVIPCLDLRTCEPCRRGFERRSHPAQKPIWTWEWFYARCTEPGMTVYDPFAGVGSSGKAAQKHGLNWIGSEIDAEFARVGQMWLADRWFPGSEQQLSMF